jgi:hypothetical protein
MEPFYALTNPFVLLVIGVLSVARFTRLVTHDTWPPVEWLRPRVAAKLKGWSEVVVCPFCAAPYLVAGQMLWFWLTYRQGEHSTAFVWGWLVPNLWWAVSYVAAMVVAYDQPED